MCKAPPEDKETILMCPQCHSTDVFAVTKTGECVCKGCWTKGTPFDFLCDMNEVYGPDDYLND